jgi:hypothetical protein
MQFAGWYVPWKVASGEENLVLQALQFQKIGVSAVNFQDWLACHRSRECFMEG